MNTAQLLLLAVYLCLVLEAWNHRSPLKSKEAPYAHEAGALVRAMCGRERRDCKAYVRRDCSISYAMGRICHFFFIRKNINLSGSLERLLLLFLPSISQEQFPC